MTQIQFTLRSKVYFYESDRGGSLISMTDKKTLSLNADAVEVVNGLQSGWLTEDEAAEKTNDLNLGYFTLITMQKAGMLDARIVNKNKKLFTLSPSPEDSAFKKQIESGTTYHLNRYAYLHQAEDALLLESPLTPCRITIFDAKLTGMIHQLCTGMRLDIAGDDAKTFLSVLIALGIAEPAGMEKENDPMDFWQFHDLLYYARTLDGKNAYPTGGTYRFREKRPTIPINRESVSDTFIALPEPTEELAESLNTPFSEVLGMRQSQREFSENFITLEELGAFFHAAARIKSVQTIPDNGEIVTMRPSPSGGARHALEIYPLIKRCEGVPPGAYRYDAANHRLERVPTTPDKLKKMLEENPYEFLGGESPQITLNISARIGRTAWKYESIAYKLINQDMGCLYQTFYLVATALGLAPCALGSVNTEKLGKAHGIDWSEEPFIGAFTLGKTND
ncbi:SagB-type dehydrogenase domain-containing protein [Maridesulfovibrio ferrireducens]|uniref:SagB-type dehydrogenase domain-containing protein n=2 Tax=Maridesulfovibrio ferrireducens TaxID=246191 RepID=A0A1G9KTD8_9BACT|nr:SagB-type dehydrogenase domain-containing protein [Maridesulfovibrio ferrireducens]